MSESLTMVTSAQLLRRIKAEGHRDAWLAAHRRAGRPPVGLDGPACVDVLERLITERFLQRRPDGTYARLTDGLPAHQPMRMIKAG